MISLRPRGEHESLRRAAVRHGGGLIALSPFALRDRNDPAVRDVLSRALAAPIVLFTSPASVRASNRLQPLRPLADGRACWMGVGAGTLAALRQAGVTDAVCPQRMDSEGLLAMPQLQQLDRTQVGLVTAPGGRGVLAPALDARGAKVIRADVYERVPVPLSPRALAALRSLSQPAVLALSSGEALQRTLAAAPDDISCLLRATPVVAASERLAAQARQSGCARIRVAASAQPGDLVQTAIDMHQPHGASRAF